jgi:hypothetical protein
LWVVLEDSPHHHVPGLPSSHLSQQTPDQNTETSGDYEEARFHTKSVQGRPKVKEKTVPMLM